MAKWITVLAVVALSACAGDMPEPLPVPPLTPRVSWPPYEHQRMTQIEIEISVSDCLCADEPLDVPSLDDMLRDGMPPFGNMETEAPRG